MRPFDDENALPWERVEPPLWWPEANAFIIGDRHLPDGTRQHLTLGKQPPGRMVANAHVLGIEDLGGAVEFGGDSPLSGFGGLSG